ncbi:hypothetical protein B0G69_6610 [Paraburkholderia sp. RAU2J]|uniref:hypothetical protein n=1 Tax=Paraburkholderia sp. RAU2J TaxID=1938810 RepID=UPI000F1A1E93|nr:hypothetical protein [Paraburkholderia sp. RAU2J]RKT13457.1 hypothetical protein B0G69_6610 [Paraburkholderia sp. RAU2J]
MLLKIRKHKKRQRHNKRGWLWDTRVKLHCKRKTWPVRAPHKYGSLPPRNSWKASETRREQQQCTARRRAMYEWLSSLSASVGEIESVPHEQGKTSTEFRLGRMHPAIRIFLTANTIAVSIHYRGRCWDIVKCSEAAPAKTSGGWFDAFNPPEFKVIYPDLDTLWCEEVFEPFCRWFGLMMCKDDSLILYGTRDDTTWAKLMPTETPMGLFEVARFPVWLAYCSRAGWQ